MSQEVRAIYENGQFRPLDPVSLPEQGLVSLVITPATSTAPTDIERRRALHAALDEAAQLPIEGSDDGFSGADHDLILYGWKK
jgi:predicted DNA-binding antitoxin AbrB/MazE fold protein